MYDYWVEQVDQKKIAGACLIDLSSAFNVVDADLLDSKLELYGWDVETRKWIKSYMTSRSQMVYIEGSLSPPRKVNYGVPQGSILGPLLYLIFTNEFPEVIHVNCPENNSLRDDDEGLWSMKTKDECTSCGSIVIYADDSTYSTSGKDGNETSGNIGRSYSLMADYLSSSGLKVNDDKTHSLILTTARMRKTRDIGVTVTTGDTVSETSKVER